MQTFETAHQADHPVAAALALLVGVLPNSLIMRKSYHADPMRFLIVDQSRECRSAVAGMLRARWPEAEIDEWDPRERGRLPAPQRDRYAAVLLDVDPADGGALSWMADMLRNPDMPPVLLLAEARAESLAIMALKAGAADFLRKAGLAGEALVR